MGEWVLRGFALKCGLLLMTSRPTLLPLSIWFRLIINNCHLQIKYSLTVEAYIAEHVMNSGSDTSLLVFDCCLQTSEGFEDQADLVDRVFLHIQTNLHWFLRLNWATFRIGKRHLLLDEVVVEGVVEFRGFFVAEAHGTAAQFQFHFAPFALCLLDAVLEREQLSHLLQYYFCHYFQILLRVQEYWNPFQQRWLSTASRGFVEPVPLGFFEGDEGMAFGQLPVGQSIHWMVKQLRIVDSRHVFRRIGIEGSCCHLASLSCIPLEHSQPVETVQSGLAFFGQ